MQPNLCWTLIVVNSEAAQVHARQERQGNTSTLDPNRLSAYIGWVRWGVRRYTSLITVVIRGIDWLSLLRATDKAA
jgi:hypothetical protein